MDNSEIKSFYDEFLETKMLDYRVHGNLRIEKATERILDFVCQGDVVVDVGCGIGITTESISKRADHVWAFDISERNIWYAQETVEESNTTFFSADVLENRKRIKDRIPSNVDVVTLVDVIEHIPQESHEEMFEFFKSILGNKSFVILTYPSPQYQRYLKEHNPSKLQIIDQVIELRDLVRVARSAGLSLRHYSLETVWKPNQYIHCVLQTDSSLSSPPRKPADTSESLFRRVINSAKFRVRHNWKKYVSIPYKKWKYVDSIFN